MKDSLIVLGFSVIFSLVSYFLIYRNIVTVPNQIRHFLVHFFCFPVGISLNHLFLFFDQKYTKIRDFIYRNSNWLFGLGLAMIYLILSSRTYYFHFINPKFATTLSFITVYTFVVVFFSTIILYFAESNCVQTKELNFKRMFAKPIAFFEILGILSYGFYLWHGDILNFYRKSIGITNYSQYITVMLLSFLTTLFVSYGTYILIEKRKF